MRLFQVAVGVVNAALLSCFGKDIPLFEETRCWMNGMTAGGRSIFAFNGEKHDPGN